MGNRVKGRPKKSSIKAALSSHVGSKRKLSRMGKVRKKNHAGLDATMIGRSKCLRLLQLDIKDFRRLCILKGIYPREPIGGRAPKNKKGQTFYHIKDIRAIAHEPILETFRATRAFLKKVRRAAGRNEPTEAARKHAILPTYTLHRLVKERYPRFVDALADLDDALTLVFLFAALPSTEAVASSVVQTSKHLAAAWGAYCATSHTLTKSFVSVRGVYLEASIHNTTIRWIVPHAFTQFMPDSVDFRIMGTFLEFYATLLRFVLFQLYTELGVQYPLGDVSAVTGSTSSVVASNLRALRSALDAASLGQVVSASVDAESKTKQDNTLKESTGSKSKESKKSSEVNIPQLPSEDEDEEVDDANVTENMKQQLEEAFAGVPLSGVRNDEDAIRQRLFSGFTFFLSREVPRGYIELVCLSFGAKAVGWEADDSPISVGLSLCLHLAFAHIFLLAPSDDRSLHHPSHCGPTTAFAISRVALQARVSATAVGLGLCQPPVCVATSSVCGRSRPTATFITLGYGGISTQVRTRVGETQSGFAIGRRRGGRRRCCDE